MRLAHLSDLHLWPEGALSWEAFQGRRLAGAANLLLTRHASHRESVVRAAVRTIAELGVDHVVCTGDVVNLALPAEFALAAEVLSPLGGFDRFSICPGNHDYYTPEAIAARRFESHFGPWIWASGDGAWPAHKDLPGGVRLILGRSATQPPPLMANGYIGAAQADRMESLAREALQQGLTPVLAIHHYLHLRRSFREVTGFLADRWRLRRVAERSGVVLIMHGHDHAPHRLEVAGREGRTVLVSGCGSTARYAPHRGQRGRFHVYDIADGRVTVQAWQAADPDRFEPLPG
jgi:3',5'-cyclic AMP phosphodiesterase CpdA